MTERLNPWVRCQGCQKIHIAQAFEFVCECGQTVDLWSAKVKVKEEQ